MVIKKIKSFMCKLVFRSLLNFTHITQWFLFVPNPKMLGNVDHISFAERGVLATDLALPKILAWRPYDCMFWMSRQNKPSHLCSPEYRQYCH